MREISGVERDRADVFLHLLSRSLSLHLSCRVIIYIIVFFIIHGGSLCYRSLCLRFIFTLDRILIFIVDYCFVIVNGWVALCLLILVTIWVFIIIIVLT
jgi:hypothetical protein